MKMRKTLFTSFLIGASIFALSSSVFAGSEQIQAQKGSLPEVFETIREIPPTGFNPLNATPQELQKYGFPAKPTNLKDLQTWTNAMSHAKTYDPPQQTASNYVHGALDHATYSKLWAGYVAEATNNKVGGVAPVYNHVQAAWVQPTYTGTIADPSLWVGIGGYYTNTTGLVQAGADSYASGAGGSSRYEFWVEDYPNGTIWEASPAVSAGNTLYSDVTYNGSTSSAFLENITTGHYTTITFNTPYYDGSTADFVFEFVGAAYDHWGSTTMQSSYFGYKVGSTSYTGQLGTGTVSTEVIATDNGLPTGNLRAYPSSSITSNGDFTLYSY